jgi:hypothetical protein
MQPVHKGLENHSLYSQSAMTSVTVCLESGMLATEACQTDVRAASGYSRVASALVYPEDIPQKACTKHTVVDYCVTGGGVATEYCKNFANVDKTVVLAKQSLVKLTLKEMEDILKAENYRLEENMLRDDYVYLVNPDGSDGTFKGFHNTANVGVTAPYAVCPEHTQASWQAYQAANPAQPTDPNAPGNTTVTPDTTN